MLKILRNKNQRQKPLILLHLQSAGGLVSEDPLCLAPFTCLWYRNWTISGPETSYFHPSMLQDTSTSGLEPQYPETQDRTKIKEKVVAIYGGILIGKIMFRKVSSTQNPG